MAIRKLDGDRVAVCPEAMQSLVVAYSELTLIKHEYVKSSTSKEDIESKAHQVLQKDQAFENNMNHVSE